MKYYAFYNGSAVYDLLDENEFNEQLNDAESSSREYFRINMQEFNNLKDAKNYLCSHFKDEIAEIKNSTRQVRNKK